MNHNKLHSYFLGQALNHAFFCSSTECIPLQDEDRDDELPRTSAFDAAPSESHSAMFNQ